MNFNELMQKMRELDQPVPEMAVVEEPNEGNEFSGALKAAKDSGQSEFEVDGKKYKVKEDGSLEECPMDSMPSPMSKPDTTPPSMSVNLNAQGMDDIAELMKLMTKVNPDMINQPAPMSMPPISAEPNIISIKPPMSGIGDLGNLDSGPLKMLPNLDKDEPHSEPDADNMGGPSDNDADNMPPMGDLDSDDKGVDSIQKSMGDNDGDGDHDMDDHDMEKDDKDDEEKKKEAFGNAPAGASDQEYHDIDAAIPNGNDLNRSKKSFSGKPYRGDNPMAAGAYESKEELRASIKEELRRRLSEAKVK